MIPNIKTTQHKAQRKLREEKLQQKQLKENTFFYIKIAEKMNQKIKAENVYSYFC